jgi:hypothetical protein
MGLETFGTINNLNASNPASGDVKSQGDDHIRGIKSTLLATFPNFTGALSLSQSQIASISYVDSQAFFYANYKGLWSSLTGALAIPASVYHLSKYWTLTTSLTDVTAKVPGTAPEWTEFNPNPIKFGGLAAYPSTEGNSFSYAGATWLKTGVTALSSAYPSAPATVVGDGIVWSSKTLAATITTPQVIAFGNGRLIVMNSGADYGVSDDNGLTFQLRNTPTAMQVSEGSLVWGYSQVWMWMNAGGTLAYISYDNGDNWVPITNPSNGTHSVDNRNLVYAAGKWVSVGNSGTVSIKYSTDDGLTWTAPTQFAGANDSIAYGNGLYVVFAAAGGTRTQTSSDAITWTTYASAMPVAGNAIHFANSVFVATAQAASTSIYTSSNGQSFAAKTMPSSQTWRGMCVYNGTFFASTTAAGTVGATSTDMTTFTARTLVSGDGTYTNSAVGNGFVAFRGTVNYSVSSTGGSNYVDNFVALYADSIGRYPLYMRVA